MAKVDPVGGGDCFDPESTSALLLSPVKRMPLQKKLVEDAGGQGGIKGKVRH